MLWGGEFCIAFARWGESWAMGVGVKAFMMMRCGFGLGRKFMPVVVGWCTIPSGERVILVWPELELGVFIAGLQEGCQGSATQDCGSSNVWSSIHKSPSGILPTLEHFSVSRCRRGRKNFWPLVVGPPRISPGQPTTAEGCRTDARKGTPPLTTDGELAI